MIVLRNNRVLTLINAIRLNEDGERRLLKLGTVQHIIRLGPSHGAYDDEYYINNFNAQLWSPGLSVYHPDLAPIHCVIDENTILPIPNAELFLFQYTKTQEAAILLKHDGGNLLITSELLQCQWDNPFINTPTKVFMNFSGLMEFPIVISPKWLKNMTPKQGSIKEDFERLLRLDFDMIIGASSNLVYKGAKEGVVLAVDSTFPVWS
jgi:hypothetical protein